MWYVQSTYDGPPKLIVFGGNGFVGTRVCEEALQTGLAVVSVSRSGAPKSAPSASWTSQVDWLSVSFPCPCTWTLHDLLVPAWMQAPKSSDGLVQSPFDLTSLPPP